MNCTSLHSPCISNPAKKDYGSKRSHKADTLSKVWKIAAETRTKICRICSKYQGDRSRKLQAENSGLFIAPKQNQKKNLKIWMFSGMFFSIGLLQDAAYSVNKIKFNSGEKQKVSNIILTMKYSPTISYYKQVCYESLFSSLSDSSLWRILHGIKP